jgi:hypothetical protein
MAWFLLWFERVLKNPAAENARGDWQQEYTRVSGAILAAVMAASVWWRCRELGLAVLSALAYQCISCVSVTLCAAGCEWLLPSSRRTLHG